MGQRIFRVLILACGVVATSACAPLAPWERGILAQPRLRFHEAHAHGRQQAGDERPSGKRPARVVGHRHAGQGGVEVGGLGCVADDHLDLVGPVVADQGIGRAGQHAARAVDEQQFAGSVADLASLGRGGQGN